MIAYGGGTFVSALIEEGLIDEFHLFVNPVLLGSGMTIFKGLPTKLGLTLQRSVAFPCGIVLLCYLPTGN
jgi:dihydrofolate reductase